MYHDEFLQMFSFTKMFSFTGGLSIYQFDYLIVTTTANVEILIWAGRINIEDMRLIQLMHPECQINTKLVGKKVLANAEICN